MRRLPGGRRRTPSRASTAEAVYEDNVQSFTTTEPAIDLTASSMLAFSWQAAAQADSSALPGEAPAVLGPLQITLRG